MRSRFLLLLVSAAVAACADAPTVPSALPLAGTYDMVSLNGGALPQAIAVIPPDVWQVTGGTVILRDDSTFRDVTRGRVVTSPPFPAQVTDDSSAAVGTYSRFDSTLTLTLPSDGHGAQENYVLTVHADGSLTRFSPRGELGGPYLDVTYRYTRH